jgi:acyl-coenzyme A thioesterase PaaI-like protein
MSDKVMEYGIEPPADLIELAHGMRDLIEKMMVIDEAHPELRRARRQVDDITRRLDQVGRKGLQARMLPEVEPGPDDMRPYLAGNIRRWHYNPINPPIHVEMKDNVLRGTVNLGLAYEGPPGCVHGGLVAMLLDQLMGQANYESGVPGMTASLTVRYRRPTPLLTELTLEAGPPQMIDERKCVTRGTIRVGDTITADARGLFILPQFGSADLPMMHRGGFEGAAGES